MLKVKGDFISERLGVGVEACIKRSGELYQQQLQTIQNQYITEKQRSSSSLPSYSSNINTNKPNSSASIMSSEYEAQAANTFRSFDEPLHNDEPKRIHKDVERSDSHNVDPEKVKRCLSD